MNKKRTAKATLVAFGLSLVLPCAAMAASDIDGHWAQSVLEKWEAKGLIGGYEDGTVRPDAELSRAEMVAFINRAAGLTEGTTISFKDVAPTDWYAAEVAAAVNAGYIGGYEDNTFRGSNAVTRAELASMIARVNNLEEDAARAEQFADAAELPAWAKGAIGAVANAGYMVGSDNKFNGDAAVTRAEAVVSLDRAYPNAGEEKEEEKKPVSGGGGFGGGGGYIPTPTPTVSEEVTVEVEGVGTVKTSVYDANTVTETIAVSNGADETISIKYDGATTLTGVTVAEITNVTLEAGDYTVGEKTVTVKTGGLSKAVSDLATGDVVEITLQDLINNTDEAAEKWTEKFGADPDRVVAVGKVVSSTTIKWAIDGVSDADEIAGILAGITISK